MSGEEWLQWGIFAQMAAMAAWDFDSWIALSTRHVELARASGALASLSIALNGRGQVATHCGDFETATSHGISVRVTDQGGLSFDKNFTIGVTDVLEGPVEENLTGGTVAENSANGTVVGTVINQCGVGECEAVGGQP